MTYFLGESSFLQVCCPMYYLSENACGSSDVTFMLLQIVCTTCLGCVKWTRSNTIIPVIGFPNTGDHHSGGLASVEGTLRVSSAPSSHRHRLITATWPKSKECTGVDPLSTAVPLVTVLFQPPAFKVFHFWA